MSATDSSTTWPSKPPDEATFAAFYKRQYRYVRVLVQNAYWLWGI